MSYLEIAPASADKKKWEKVEKLFADEQWVVEPKLDGWRFLMHLGHNLDRMYLTGRNVSVKTGKFSEKGLCAPKLIAYERMRQLKYTVIDGEIMPPDGSGFRDIAGIMNVEPEKAAARIKEIGHPRYWAFDILYLDGKDVRDQPWSWRKAALEDLVATYWPGSAKRELVSVVGHETDDKESYYKRAVGRGEEGVILKDQDASYGTGWVKVKRWHTVDVVITGYTEAEHGITGKYVGLIGAIKVSVYKGGKLVEVGQVSGMTDDLRKTFSEKPALYLGECLEIKVQEFAKDRLRHPTYGRWRPDMEPEDCTWKKMMADLAANKTGGR